MTYCTEKASQVAFAYIFAGPACRYNVNAVSSSIEIGPGVSTREKLVMGMQEELEQALD